MLIKILKKTFFEGHERSDVVEHRNEFLAYFLSRHDHYYSIVDKSLEWLNPSEKPFILIFHDESTSEVTNNPIFDGWVF